MVEEVSSRKKNVGRFRFIISFLLAYCMLAQTLSSSNLLYSIHHMTTDLTKDNENNSDVNLNDICKMPQKINLPDEMTNLDEYHFMWDDRMIGNILSTLSFGSVAGTLISVWIYDLVHNRIVFSVAIIMTSFQDLSLPWLAKHGGGLAVMMSRFFTGFYTGILIPGISGTVSTWFPPREKELVTSITMLSSNLGKILFSLSGYFIEAFGWESLFYLTGANSLITGILIFFVFQDEPENHPCVSEGERAYILDRPIEEFDSSDSELGDSTTAEHSDGKNNPDNEKKKSLPTLEQISTAVVLFTRNIKVTKSYPRSPFPLKQILCSLPFWTTVAGHFGVKFIGSCCTNYFQLYLPKIHGYSVELTSIYTSLPTSVSIIIFGTTFGYLNDACLTRGISRLLLRRIAAAIIVCSGAMFVLVPILDCQTINALVLPMLITCSLRSAMYASVIPTFREISPTYFRNLMGLSWTISLMSGFIAPQIMGNIGTATQHQWKIIFCISGTIFASSLFLYIAFVQTATQPWDPEYRTRRRTRVKSEINPWSSEFTTYAIFKRQSEEGSISSTLGSRKRRRTGSRSPNEFETILRINEIADFLVKYQMLTREEKEKLSRQEKVS